MWTTLVKLIFHIHNQSYYYLDYTVFVPCLYFLLNLSTIILPHIHLFHVNEKQYWLSIN